MYLLKFFLQNVGVQIMNKKSVTNQYEYKSFLKNALALKGSVTPKVWKRVFAVFIYSCLISVLDYYTYTLSIPMGPFEYAGLVLGLILVFRVNSGYDRWWEARKLWGNIVNHSRNLAIIVLSYTTAADHGSVLRVVNMISALPFLMKNKLRDMHAYYEIESLLDPQIINYLKQAEHPPLLLSSLIAQELNTLQRSDILDSFAFLKAEEQRLEIINCLGGCERILKTPMPFVMAVKSKRFIFLFLLALPLALVNVSLYFNPVVSGLVAYTLFALDQIGLELQNPFSESNLSHLPLNEICNTINNNLQELHKNGNSPYETSFNYPGKTLPISN